MFNLDSYASLDSPIHRWETRTKLVGLGLLLFTFAFVDQAWLLLPMVLVTAVLFILSRIPAAYLRSRLKLPGVIIAALVLLLPFISGETVLTALGPIAIYREGVAAAVLIAVRLLCIITLSVILFGSNDLLTTMKGLRALGLPVLLADMLLLTYRYIFEIGTYFTNVQTAARLRGFHATNLSWRNLSILAALIATLFVRSFEQSEQVYNAMILRGYGAPSTAAHSFKTETADWLKLAALIALSVAFILTQWWLSHLN